MFELTDQAFIRVQPLLPANSRRGKPWRDHRQGPGRHPVEVAHRPAGHGGMCRCGLGPGRPATAAYTAGSWTAPGPGSGRRWPPANAAQPTIPRPAGAGGGASGSGARGPDGDDATTTTTAPAAPSVASTTPAWLAAAAPPRSRPGSGPSRAAVAILRAQLPPSPAWARTAASNAWVTSTRVTCRYQGSKRRTW
jgi:hypothetical protein